MNKIEITKQDLDEQFLSEEEKQVIVDAWEEYCEDNDVNINGDAVWAKWIKRELVMSLTNKLIDELVFQRDMYCDHSLSNKDDYDNLRDTIKYSIKSDKMFPNSHLSV